MPVLRARLASQNSSTVRPRALARARPVITRREPFPWPARWAAVDGLAVPVLAFLSIKLAVLIANLWWFPTLRRPPGPRPDAGESVLLVPLRDEADRIPEALPGMLAAGFGEVVLLDDGSTDGTAELVEQLLRSAWSGSPARLIPGRPRPAGWAGKPWACAQLAQASDAAT